MKKSRRLNSRDKAAKRMMGAYAFNESGIPRLGAAIGLPQDAADPEYLEAVKLMAAHVLFPLQDNPVMGLLDRGPEGDSLLHVACGWGDLRAVQLLSEASCDINAKDEMDATPLSRAVNGRYLNIVEFLIKRGADPNIKSAFGYSPLDWAVHMDYTEIADVLRKR